MNRSLWIPACFCVTGFAALTAAFHMAAGRENTAQAAERTAATNRGQPTVATYAAAASTLATSSTPARSDVEKHLSQTEAEQMLTTLAAEYLRPWREWEASPRRLFSRVAPRPIPAILAKVEMTPSPGDQHENFAMAAIVVRKGEQTETYPCVVARGSQAVWVFADGKWLPSDNWLAAAPLPN